MDRPVLGEVIVIGHDFEGNQVAFTALITNWQVEAGYGPIEVNITMTNPKEVEE
jgi:hypothetical protein